MKPSIEWHDSALMLSLDLMSAKVLVWMASVGRDAVLTSDAHMYFFDRYHRLAEHHRRRGHFAKARRLEAKAAAHYVPDGPPPRAAAMAMPRPRQFVRTDAVSRINLDGPDDAA
jgi:hypothetical protein